MYICTCMSINVYECIFVQVTNSGLLFAYQLGGGLFIAAWSFTLCVVIFLTLWFFPVRIILNCLPW